MFTERQKYLIRLIVNKKYDEARNYLPQVLAENSSKKNESFVRDMIEELNTRPTYEIPPMYKNLVEGGHLSDEEMKRYVLSSREELALSSILQTRKAAKKLEDLKVHYTNATLLYGPSECGKTMFAKYLAYKMGLPLYYVNFSTAVDSMMGATSKNIAKIF